jgi:eukaryotic-like serine/threonine-protein kinase
MVLQPGARFGHFTVEALLGEGGMGQVYRAFDARLERRVALKILHGKDEGGSGAVESGPSVASILREARAAAALDHPNAVSIFEVGEHESTPFLAMELVAGTSLRAFIGRSDVPVEPRLRWLADIARALDAAHRAGIVHLDVKPENVMVRADGVVKVLDFGIARRAELPAPALQDVGDVVRRASVSASACAGTPAYMAPEQVRGGRVDGRTDQFAWGVVAFELLSGRKPWATDEGIEVLLRSIMLVDPPRLRGVALAVEAVVLRALEKADDNRFPTMAEAAAALESASGAKPAATFAGPFSEPAPSPWDYPSGAPTETIPQLVRPVITDASVSPEGRTEAALVDPSGAAPVPAAGRALRRLGAIALGVALPALAIGWAALSPVRLGSAASRPAVHAPASAAAVTLLDLPSPRSCKPAALAEYQGGMHALHDGTWDRAQGHFERAVAADPDCAEAELRLVMTAHFTSPIATVREAYSRAEGQRAALGERDRLLLDALDPIVRRDPADDRACAERLRALAARFPADAELAFLAANYSVDSDPEAALAAARHAVALDPDYADAWQTLARVLHTQGHAEDALAALDQCMRASPNAVDCVTDRIATMRNAGRCAEMEAGARQWIAREPDSAHGYLGLAQALAAERRPAEAVEEALRQRWSHLSGADRRHQEPYERALLAVLAGDFEAAERSARELQRAVEGEASFDLHVRAASLLVSILRETGRASEAAGVASALLQRKAAWSSHLSASPFDVADFFFEPLLLGAVRHAPPAGVSWESERVAWMAETRGAAKLGDASIWSLGVASFAETEAEAVEALRSMPPALQHAGQGDLARHRDSDVFAARALLLAGRPAEALALARPVAASCIALDDPFVHTEAELRLGEALEATGDRAAACAAYHAVLERWGGAHPRSSTAERAGGRLTAIGCTR